MKPPQDAEKLDKAIRRSLAVLRQTLGHNGEVTIDGSYRPATLPSL